jgi:hypothetical protein
MSAPASEIQVRELLQLLASGGREAVAERVGAWVLVGAPNEADEDSWSYRTLSARSVREVSADGEVLTLGEDYRIYPVRKRSEAFADTVLVGRASSNDCVIVDGSVSKLHARIKLQAGVAAAIADAGSHNGTVVEGERVAPDTWRDLRADHLIELGDRMLRLMTDERLCGLLERLARAQR